MRKNPQKTKEYARKYYLKHREELLKKRRERYLQKYYNDGEYRKKVLERSKNYRKKNSEKYREYRRRYRYENPAGIYSVLKDGLTRKGKKRKELLKISKEEFVKWYNSQLKICHYCKRTFKEIKSEKDSLNNKINRLTIDRVDNKKPYEIGNIVLACYRCNSIKGDYFTEDEMMKIGKIIYEKWNSP